MAFASTRDVVSYADAVAEIKKDPVAIMEQAADNGLTTSQLVNRVSPETIVEQRRSFMGRLAQDEGLSFVQSEVSAPSPVMDFARDELGHVIMFDYLHGRSREPYLKFNKQRQSIIMPNDAPIDTPTNTAVTGSITVDTPVGMTLDPSELVADSHDVKASTYKPFQWKYEKERLGRSNVAPGSAIPPSTLGQKEKSIEMQKWGNRFKIPYEVMRVEEVRINKVAQMIDLESITEEVRLYDELVGILLNGDGTPDSAAKEHAQSTLTGKTVTAGTLNLWALGNFVDEAFTAPHYCSHIILPQGAIRDLKEQMGDDSGQIIFTQLAQMGLFPRLQSMDPRVSMVRFGKANPGALSDGKVIGLDARMGVEMVNQTGSDIREQARIIRDQTEEMTISNTYLWAKLELAAVQVLTY